jgi:hypothetical protein
LTQYDFMTQLTKRTQILLLAALLTGLLARLPGVWWGANFPPGWYGHHPDEYTHSLHAQLLINKHQPAYQEERSSQIRLRDPWAAGYSVTPYPKGMAMHVAAPIIAWRWLAGVDPVTPPPPSAGIIPPGRVVSVLYGTASILLLFLLARQLFRSNTVPLLSAWLLALGGLHVTQSHFFLADVPALFWILLGTLLLWRDLADTEPRSLRYFSGAAFCMGIAFGLKLAVAWLPALGLAALMKRNWPARVVLAGMLFLAGMLVVNLGTYTPLDFYRTMRSGIADPFIFPIGTSALLYLIELPVMIGLPLFIAALAGTSALLTRLIRMRDARRRLRLGVIVVLPLLVQLLLVLFKLDHFLRHLIAFVPWLVMCAAWMLVKAADYLQLKFRLPWLALPVLVLVWQALLVYDGEKGFIDEPRNRAAEWLYANISEGSTLWWYYHSLPDYTTVPFPEQQPDVLLEEMHHANHYLKGVSLDGVMPRDYRYIFDSESQMHVDAFQELFTGNSGYQEVARFGENYFMPEYVLVDRCIGNRSRNYLAEVVIFAKHTSDGSTGP